MRMNFRISSVMCPASYVLLKSSQCESIPSSPRANIISKFTSLGSAAFAVFEFCNTHATSSLSIDGPDSHIFVLSSVSFLSSLNSLLMYFSYLHFISTFSNKIVPSSEQMRFEAGIGPFLVISRMMLSISLILLFLCSISWHLSSNHLFLMALHFS